MYRFTTVDVEWNKHNIGIYLIMFHDTIWKLSRAQFKKLPEMFIIEKSLFWGDLIFLFAHHASISLPRWLYFYPFPPSCIPFFLIFFSTPPRGEYWTLNHCNLTSISVRVRLSSSAGWSGIFSWLKYKNSCSNHTMS